MISIAVIRGFKMTNISTARVAIEELKKSAAPADRHHCDTLSSALAAAEQAREG